MADTYEIIKGIKQAAMYANDFPEGYGCREEDLDFLKRSEGDKVLDSRVMDGFDAKINGDILTITYQSETTMEEAHDNNFENDVRRTLNKIRTYLQREYKNITDNSIQLEQASEAEILLQQASRARVWIEAQQHFRIPSLDPVEDEERKEDVDELDTLLRECRKKAGLGD